MRCNLDPDARHRMRGAGPARPGTFVGTVTSKELSTEGLAFGWTWRDCDVVVLDQVR
jgi:alpha-galactosidase